MKRLALSAIVLVLALSLSACAVNPNIRAVPYATVHTGNSSASPETAEQTGSGAIGDYAVKIDGFEVVKDGTGEGDPAVVVTYEWTNNSNKTAGFSVAIQDKVSQGGDACSATTLTGNDKYDFDSILVDIEPGATQTVQRIYRLNDADTPIDIEISAMGRTEKTPSTVKQTFEIK